MPNEKPPTPNFGSQSRSLVPSLSFDARLDSAKLTPEEIATEVTKRMGQALQEAIAGLLPYGSVVTNLIAVAAKTDEALKQKKLEMLLNEYFRRADHFEETLAKLTTFVTDPWGNALFGKITRILDDNPPDTDLLGHLARALAYIANSDFKALFSEHKFALAQIEQLTPQALALIADHDHWPTWAPASVSSSNGVVTSPWDSEFVPNYGRAVGFDSAEKRRLSHVIYELKTRGFAEAELARSADGRSQVRPKLTSIARDLLKYLT